MRIAYCGYDFFHSCLARIINDGHELVELFTWQTDDEYDFNEKVTAMARDHAAPISLNPITLDDLRRLNTKAVDVLITAAYPYRIPDWVRHVPYALNIHPSLLPQGRGPWPLPWVIKRGLPETGVTLHAISPEFDEGDILMQRSIRVSHDHETLESLSVKSQIMAERMLSDLLSSLDMYWTNKKPQGAGSYWPMPSSDDRTIEWHMGVDEIDRIVRAFSKFEPFLYIDGCRYFVRAVNVWREEHNHAPGTLVHVTNKERVYAVNDGLMCLTDYRQNDPSASEKAS